MSDTETSPRNLHGPSAGNPSARTSGPDRSLDALPSTPVPDQRRTATRTLPPVPDQDSATPVPSPPVPDQDSATPVPSPSVPDQNAATPVPSSSVPDQNATTPVPSPSVPDQNATVTRTSSSVLDSNPAAPRTSPSVLDSNPAATRTSSSVLDQNPTAPRPPSSSSTAAAAGVIPQFAPAPAGEQRRFAVAGTGHRAGMYVGAITGEHADVATLVAWLDPNPGRIDHYDAEVGAALGTGGPAGLPRYAPDGLERMIAEQRVDVVIVTAPDHAHADLVARALAAGADVVVEKPLTTDRAGCRRITSAVAESGRDVTMTFNYRYAPRNSSLREVIRSGAIGEVTSVHFEWVLDTVHGADYFRRWHREKQNSGGLLVHKSSHHFDLVNWWLGDVPSRVYASGGLRFYGDRNAAARGLGPRPARGTGTSGDPFALDLTHDPRLRSLYLDAEHHDGYLRDQDVFGPGITIEDNLSLVVDYRRGATMTYSLNAHSPWEGYRVAVNGTAGRAELEVVERGAVELDADGNAILDPSATPGAATEVTLRPAGERLLVQRHWEQPAEHVIPAGIGGHGGGDAILLKDVFRRHLRVSEDELGRPAGYLDGLRAVAVGIAANQSLVTGLPVTIRDLDLGADLSLASAVHAAPVAAR